MRPPIVSEPARLWADMFAEALNETVPLPVPLAPPMTVSQLVLLVAVQLHPVVATTDVVADPPPAPTVRLVGVSVTSHAAPAWVTVKDWPATFSVPVRACAVAFAAAVNVTAPLPVPLPPLVTDSHAVAVLDDHAQPAGAVTFVAPLPPPAATDWLPGEIE